MSNKINKLLKYEVDTHIFKKAEKSRTFPSLKQERTCEIRIGQV